MPSKGDNPKPIEKVVEEGLKALESEENLRTLEAKKEFLNEIKRHGLAVWRALNLYVLRDHPDELKRHIRMTPRRK